DETTRARREAFDRSAFVKFARMIQARSSFAPERLAPEKSAPTNFAPKRFAPDKLARLKPRLLRSRSSSDFPDKSAGRSWAPAARRSGTWAGLRWAAQQGEAASISNAQMHLAALFMPAPPRQIGSADHNPNFTAGRVVLHLQQICSEDLP